MIEAEDIDHGGSTVSEEANQDLEPQSNESDNPLNLVLQEPAPLGSPLPNNRPIASNRDEDLEDFVGYMD